MAADFDPRVTPARPDLAARALEGRLAADRYIDPIPMQVRMPVAGLRRAPERTAELDDQLLFGELFDLLESKDGWGWGQAPRDGYVGWVRLETLSEQIETPTHRIAALRTFALAEPSIKAPPKGRYSLNALVTVEAQDDRFLKIAGSGWIAATHLAPLGQFETDPATVAERFVGTPYLWGGRDSLGLDCSGLVQQALYACGQGCPRDSDQQAATLGRTVSAADVARGDLVAWAGHVGLMVGDSRLLHATAEHMAVVIEPLADVIARRGGPEVVRRL
ncbi:MAG: NlpC/P60 family protein [Caulobacteraceae bacterium]